MTITAPVGIPSQTAMWWARNTPASLLDVSLCWNSGSGGWRGPVLERGELDLPLDGRQRPLIDFEDTLTEVLRERYAALQRGNDKPGDMRPPSR